MKRFWKYLGVGYVFVCVISYYQHNRYYTEEFDWKRGVVSVRRLQPLSKLEKNWTHKHACIEGINLVATP